MADTQNEIYAQSYGQNIMQLAQQKYSQLLGTVYMKPNVNGKIPTNIKGYKLKYSINIYNKHN